MKFLKTINEYRNQMEIPFDGKDPILDKPQHIHVVDAIKHLSVNKNTNTFFSSRDVIKKSFYDNLQAGFELFLTDNSDNDYYIDGFVNNLNSEDYNYYVETGEYDHSKFSDYMYREFESNLETHDFYDNMVVNERGLIRIWRAISITKDGEIDEFTKITKKYDGVGIFWTWDKDYAYPYSGSVFGGTYILSALIKPEDINWEMTIYKNSYDLKDEREIEVNPGCFLIVDGIYKTDRRSGGNKVLINDQTWVIRA